MRAITIPLVGLVATLLACTPTAPQVPPTPTAAPTSPPTATPPPPTATPTPRSAADLLGGVLARQAELRTFRQALSLEAAGTGPGGQPLAANVWAEGESARPDSRLAVGTDALGVPLGFSLVQADSRTYVNPGGAWFVTNGQALPAGLPLVPVPVAADPQAMLPLLQGAHAVPELGVVVRGARTDVLRFTVPPDRADALASQVALPSSLVPFLGRPTYTDLSGELAVGNEDGFVRRVALLLRGHADGDPARPFSVRSVTELWDVNDPAIAVAAPDGPVFVLPAPLAGQ